MTTFKKIGTVERHFCKYDDKEHEVTLTEYLVRLTGDTYHFRELIWNECIFHWDAMDKAWYANVESEEEINRLYQLFSGTGVKFAIRPVFRITDM